MVVDAVASAPVETLQRITASLRSIPDLRGDSTSRRRPSELFAINDGPTDPTPEHYDGGLLDGLGPGEVAAIAATFGDDADSPFDSLRIRRLGGALTQQTPAAAVGHIEEPFLIFGVAIGAEEAVGEAVAEATARHGHKESLSLRPRLQRRDRPRQIRRRRSDDECERHARGDAKITVEDVAGFEGVHGVMWTVTNAAGEVVYQTTCTAVTLD